MLPESATITYACKDKKTISAAFTYNADPTLSNVALSLSDKRILVLPLANESKNSVFETDDKSIVFSVDDDGDEATLQEAGVTTFDCTKTGTTPITGTQPGTTPTKPTGGLGKDMQIYNNNPYHFSIVYPSALHLYTSYTTFKHLAVNWRANAPLNNQGTGILEIPIVQIDNEGNAKAKPYPLFYTAVLRVGVSPNVAHCYDTDEGYTNQKVGSLTIDGVPFKTFEFSDAATMQYMKGISYRAIHNNTCYVIEQIAHGSIYKDETMLPGTSDEELNKYYLKAGNIIRTFNFTK